MTARALAVLVLLVAVVLLPAPAPAAEVTVGSLTIDTSLPGPSEHTIGTPQDAVRLLAGSTIRVIHPRSLAIRARRLVIEPNVRIDASGTAGPPGRDAPQQQTTWISSGPQYPTDIAHERWAEAVQGQLARDLDGDNGGPGGPAAKVSIVVGAIEGADNLTIDVSGGDGGPGGKGGKGRKLVCGSPGPAHRDHWQAGAPGRDGRPGPRGARASVEISEIDRPPDAPLPPVHVMERPPPIPRRDYALVVSGGSSLGAYEAGYTWAFLRTLKVDRDLPLAAAGPMELDPRRPPARMDGRTRLVGVAGASAGSINALLSAVTWCQGEAWDSSESATDNLFWSTWVGIGFTDLFPGPDARYGPDDGLFSRAAFDRVKRNVLDRLHGAVRRGGAEARQFLPGCRLRLGVAVTKRTPETVEHAGMALPRARFLTAVEATAEDDALRFHRIQASSLAAPGDWLHLEAEPGSDRVPAEELISALEASAAIPWVFSPKQLRFCSEVVGDLGRTSFACPDPERAAPEFVDGGVFDNLPIGLALAFRPAPGGAAGAAEEFHVVALDPDRRRSLAAAPDETGPAGKKGLDNVVAWAKGFVNVSRKYELRTLFETPAVRLSDDRLDYSGRFAPVYGSEAMSFGAFFLRGFREFDYHSGVYDALLDLSLQTCRALPETGSDDELVRCLVQGMHRRMTALGLGGDTAYVAKRLLARELACIHSSPAGLRSALQRYALPANGAVTVTFQQWLDDTGQPSPAIGVLADEALRLVDGAGGACRQLPWSDVPGARGGRLTAAAAVVLRRDPSAIAPAERPFAEHPAEFATDTVADVLERMRQLERGDGNATGMRAADLGGLGVETYARVEGVGTARTPLTLPPHAPALTALLPYYFSAGRLFELGWRPLHRQNAYLGVGIPLILRWNDVQGAGWENFTAGTGAALTFPFSWAKPNTLLGRIAPWGLTAVELSAVATWCAAEQNSVPVGGEVAIYGLAGKLRVAVGRTDLFGGRDISLLRGSRTYVGVGVADLGGLLYWGWKALTAKGG